MRLWSLHPKYLDPQGLVALWRETLLAQAVLHNETRGYRNHPQLIRFKEHPLPLAALSRYLEGIHIEAVARAYTFNKSKIKPIADATPLTMLTVSEGQMHYEWQHLLAKLKLRNPAWHQQWQHLTTPEAHPLFSISTGDVEAWERL